LYDTTASPVVYGQTNNTDSEEEEETFKQTKVQYWVNGTILVNGTVMG